MGNKQVKTPNIDKLGSDGLIFDACYDTTAICMASRASIMTGMYEYKTGCNFSHGSLSETKWQLSYPVLMRAAGYRTCFAGKFGFGVQEPGATDRGYHKNENLPMDSFDVWYGWPGQGSYDTTDNEFVKQYAGKYPHVTRALGAASQDFIKAASKQDKPFCLSVSFKSPHGPTKPDPAFDHVYADTIWEAPPNYGEKGAAHLPPQAKSGRQYLSKGDAYRPDKYQSTMRDYHQVIHGVDVAVGMIRDELERQGVADNTVIIFITDNGYFCGAHNMGSKVLPYEEGSRSPLIIYDPRHAVSGKRCEAITGNIDMMPTMMELAGLPIPANVDGKSLLPLLDDPKGRVRESMALINAWGNIPAQAMSVVTEEHKYIYWFFGTEGMQPAEELYHRKNDPHEMKNLASNPEQKAVLQKMRKLYDAQLEKWAKECVQGNSYPEYVTLFDRSLPWEEKEEMLPKGSIERWKKAVAQQEGS